MRTTTKQNWFYFYCFLIIFILSVIGILTQKSQNTANSKTPNQVSIQTNAQDSTHATILGSQTISQKNKSAKTNNSFSTETLANLINAYRAEQSVQPLKQNILLTQSAEKKLFDMQKNTYFDHADSNDIQSWYFLREVGYQYRFAGENLSSGYNTPWQVFSAWKESPTHNEQLLKKEYADMGIAVSCQSENQTTHSHCLVVLHLGRQN